MFNNLFTSIRFMHDNWAGISSTQKIKSAQIGEISYRGMRLSDENQVAEIYSNLNHGAIFSFSRRWLYRLAGSKLMLIASKREAAGERIVGINMYYLNRRDVIDGTIHEGFIGVVPDMTGFGIATNLREVAKMHFAGGGFRGISTRISLNNAGSFYSAIRVGFQTIEKYHDLATAEERCYMICHLAPSS